MFRKVIGSARALNRWPAGHAPLDTYRVMIYPLDMSSSGPEPPDVQLSPTGRVILGMIAFGKRTGYDIKTFVDKTTRYFWAASYGQIDPELKRLEDQALVQGRHEPSGGRARTVYELTEAGTAALERWLESDDA